MYYDYFSFSQPPFKITPDTSLFYPGGDRGAILDALLYAILNGEGIVKVVGEVGSGKTMLCRMLEKELPENVEVVYLVNPSISPENTLHAIAFELKLGVDTATSRFEVMNALQNYLLQRHSENRQVVIFVEEAQSMPIATLEEIRLLSNLETQQSKLLQIVLFGQPELDQKIALPEIRQLKERITYSFQLAPFKTDDIREYINSRIRACGHRAGDLFSKAAIRQIELYSEGLLRRINILADKSLLAAFADNSHKVEERHARIAARDSEFVSGALHFFRKPGYLAACISLLAVLGVILVGYLFLRSRAESPAPVTAVEESVLPTEDGPGPDVNTGVILSGDGNDPVAVAESDMAAVDIIVEVNPGSDEEMLAGQDNVDESTLSPGTEQLEQQLLGMASVYILLDTVDARLTAEESAQLMRQLEQLPPEAADNQLPSHSGDICQRCWTIIYRPVRTSENL